MTDAVATLLGQRGGSVAAPLIMIGVVIVGAAAAVLLTRLSVRRRRRARRMARAGAATPVAPPSAAPSGAAPSGPAPIEWRRVRSRVRTRAPIEPVPQSPPAAAGPSDPDVADQEVIADPLARLEREILKQGAAASAAASRRNPPGDGAYRLGQVLYERGRLDEAAAAWRLAAAKQHTKAVARLAELEQTGGTDARS